MLNVKGIVIEELLKNASIYSLVQLRGQLRPFLFGDKPSAVEYVAIGTMGSFAIRGGFYERAADMSAGDVLLACLFNAEHAQFNGNRSSERYSPEELDLLKYGVFQEWKQPDESYLEAHRRSLKTTGYCDTQILWVDAGIIQWNCIRKLLGTRNMTSADVRKLAMEVLSNVIERLQ